MHKTRTAIDQQQAATAAEVYAETVLQNEYSDYHRNKWHYERTKFMLIAAYNEGSKNK